MKDPDRTKAVILRAAFQEIHRKGFKAASLGDILSRTNVTKGALYHHFPNKNALGLALLEAIEGKILERWVAPLKGAPDPIPVLREVVRDAVDALTVTEVELGCPLHNLAQEMSSLDEAFRKKVAAVYESWRKGIAQALVEGQKRGTVTDGVDPEGAASFIIGAISGCRGLAKNARSTDILRSCLDGINRYLDTLRKASA